MKKEAHGVSNLGEEEMNFLKQVRLSRDDTRKAANDLFSASHQNRERDRALLEKLFIQFPASVSMANNLLKESAISEKQFEQYEKIKVAYNVNAFFDGGHHLSSAQKRYPELLKVAGKGRPAVALKKVPAVSATSGSTNAGTTLSGASV